MAAMAETRHEHGHEQPAGGGRAAHRRHPDLQRPRIAGERADVSGPTLHNLAVDRLGAKVAQYRVVPDDRGAIEAALVEWADEARLDLILTTGGTGFAARDVTPEATRAVVEREAPALTQAMLFESLRVTPYAMLTRATAGIRKRTLIVNFPGNPKALTENFEAVAEVLPHAVDILRGVDTHAGRHAGHAGHGGQDGAPGRADTRSPPPGGAWPARRPRPAPAPARPAGASPATSAGPPAEGALSGGPRVRLLPGHGARGLAQTPSRAGRGRRRRMPRLWGSR